jgi:hypothetical protein
MYVFGSLRVRATTALLTKLPLASPWRENEPYRYDTASTQERSQRGMRLRHIGFYGRISVSYDSGARIDAHFYTLWLTFVSNSLRSRCHPRVHPNPSRLRPPSLSLRAGPG